MTASRRTNSAMTMYQILYPQSSQEEVVALLDELGVSGYTQTDKVIGRGPRGHHFDSQIWPGADGVVPDDKRDLLATALSNFNHALEHNSRGLYGLHVFTWSCDPDRPVLGSRRLRHLPH
jgi:hypothetical protein